MKLFILILSVFMTEVAFGQLLNSSSADRGRSGNQVRRGTDTSGIVQVELQFIGDTSIKPLIYGVPTEGYLEEGLYKILPAAEKLPLTSLIPTQMRIRRGSRVHFAVVIKNDGDEAKYFYIAKHQVLPLKSALDLRTNFASVNRIYRVPAKSTWHQVMSFELGEYFLGESLTLKQYYYSIDSKTALETELKRLISR